jgi:ribosomal protein S18 acetylase RimI-like enzyme
MTNIHRFLQIKSAKRFRHLHFNLLSFHFFKNSEGGNLLFFGSPQLLSPLTVIPYILAMEVILFRGKRYFVKLKEQVVGMFVIREKPEALYINSLAVAPEYRRLGIATYILNYANNLANQLDKKWLELSVLKVNIPALRLYMKVGFNEKIEKKLSLILKKKSI